MWDNKPLITMKQSNQTTNTQTQKTMICNRKKRKKLKWFFFVCVWNSRLSSVSSFEFKVSEWWMHSINELDNLSRKKSKQNSLKTKQNKKKGRTILEHGNKMFYVFIFCLIFIILVAWSGANKPITHRHFIKFISNLKPNRFRFLFLSHSVNSVCFSMRF